MFCHPVYRRPVMTLSSGLQPLPQRLGHARQGNTFLFRGIPVANCHRVVLQRLAVDSNAERGSRLVLSTITPADGALIVVEDVELGLQLAVEGMGLLGHAILV